MRKNFGSKSLMYPMPVLIVAAYDEAGVPNAMNAAWGCICDYDKVAIVLDKGHKTTANILKKGFFTVSMADAAHAVEADYLGVVSGNKVPDKLERAGLHTEKAEFVDAPVICEFPMTIECKLLDFNEESEMLIGEIVNVCADESILGEDGLIDPMKLRPITYDPVHHGYYALGERVGTAFHDGLALK